MPECVIDRGSTSALRRVATSDRERLRVGAFLPERANGVRDDSTLRPGKARMSARGRPPIRHALKPDDEPLGGEPPVVVGRIRPAQLP
jgi:hypothetical protein